MLFSIVTPTYDCLDSLPRCVGSVRGQKPVEYEHIVQDACSSDGTVEWLRSQADLQMVSEPDKGMYDAINRGWKRARGDVLAWINTDEQYLPGTLAMVQGVFQADESIDFVYGDVIVVDQNGRALAARREIRLFELYIANKCLNAASCALFYRRRLLDSGALELDAKYRYAADMDLILRLLRAGKIWRQVQAYFSLFGMDGTNLSCHPGMLAETADIQQRFGGSKWPLIRGLYMSGRYMERLISGSYNKVDLEYDWAIDEIPTYRRIVARGIGGSYITPHYQSTSLTTAEFRREDASTRK